MLLTQDLNIQRRDCSTTDLMKEGKMQKKTSILLMALIALSTIAVTAPVKGSVGNILIETMVPPSAIHERKIGENVSLYLGMVVWSGGTVDLYLSENGYAALDTTTDIFYGRRFSVAKIKGPKDTSTYPGYTVGNNWINGTLGYDYNAKKMVDVPGGNYYVKAFDGTTAAVAVTDNYLRILANFEVVPSSGPGQASIELKGYALPVNGFANLSYYDPIALKWIKIKDLHQADAKGKFVYPMLAPDLKQALPVGEQTEACNTITFRMVAHGTGQLPVNDTFNEDQRGLKQVKGENGMTAGSGKLYGNNTDFGATPTAGVNTVNVKVMGKLMIAGNHFHPGPLTILWDATTEIGTTTANGTGWFNTTVTIPITSKGDHNVTLDEGKTKFIIWVNVIQTLVLVPDKGPVGTSVTAYGYGFEKSTATTTYNVTLWWDWINYCTPKAYNLTRTKVNTVGQFTVTFKAPHSVGGAHIVNATEDDAAKTGATATFTITTAIAISPTSFTADGTTVTVSGTGLKNGTLYDLCLANRKDFDVRCDCVGDFTFKFIAASLEPGQHTVTLYVSGTPPILETNVLFNVTSAEVNLILVKLDETLDKLDGIDESLGDLADLVTGERAHLDAVRTAILAAIETARGDVSALAQELADIETLATTAAQQASSAAASSSTAATNASDAKVAAQGAQATASGISTAVYGAIILSLIAALASIVAVITLQRKVAG